MITFSGMWWCTLCRCAVRKLRCLWLTLMSVLHFSLLQTCTSGWQYREILAAVTKVVEPSVMALHDIKHHLNYGDCLEDKRENIETVLCCVVYDSCAQWCAHAQWAVLKDECWFRFSFCEFSLDYTLSKNVPPLTCYSVHIDDPIAIFFGRNVTEKVGNQMMLCFPTSPI